VCSCPRPPLAYFFAFLGSAIVVVSAIALILAFVSPNPPPEVERQAEHPEGKAEPFLQSHRNQTHALGSFGRGAPS
jgi:hypothetical protein